MDTILGMLKSIFSSYFLGLTIFCSLFLSYIYPHVLIDSNSEFKTEYIVGKFTGYVLAGGSLLGYILIKLFG